MTVAACAVDIIDRLAGNITGTNKNESISALDFAFLAPSGLTFDSAGNLLVSDQGPNKIYEIDRVTGLVTTFGGRGETELAPTSLPTADLDRRRLLEAVSEAPSLPRDWERRTGRRWERTTGRASAASAKSKPAQANVVVASKASVKAASAAAVPALEATFHSPSKQAVDRLGNTYIADTFANAIKKVSAGTGMVTLYAGSDTTPAEGGF